MSQHTAATARFVGSGIGMVHDGDDVAVWFGDADLYHLNPPLRGYTVVVVSTIADAPRVRARGGVERGIESFIYGVTGEDLQIDPEHDELPGSAWGSTAAQALAEAGYALV
jgi:hypothetical protein